MVYDYAVKHNGTLYLAGEDVPNEEHPTPKVTAVEEATEPKKATTKKTTKK